MEIIDLNSENVEEHGCYCVKDRNYPGYINKISWLKEAFKQGLKVKYLYSKKNGYLGFIEYISGENSWRGFSNPDYMFIHCLYVAKKANRNLNYGKLLLEESKKDAINSNKLGVAVISSGKAMLAENSIFLKNGFKVVGSRPPKYQLLVNQIRDGKLPDFSSDHSLSKYNQGLYIIYTDQCPFTQKSVDSIAKVAKEYKLDLKVIRLNSPKEAQEAPSIYGVYNLIYNGKLIAEHYISEKRFKNILEKELKILK